jgi:hypothetical protein
VNFLNKKKKKNFQRHVPGIAIVTIHEAADLPTEFNDPYTIVQHEAAKVKTKVIKLKNFFFLGLNFFFFFFCKCRKDTNPVWNEKFEL